VSVNSKRREALSSQPSLRSTSLADPDRPAVGHRVLEAGVLAVGPVAKVALHGDDLLGDLDDLVGPAEPDTSARRG
jgi:hypothetical protein